MPSPTSYFDASAISASTSNTINALLCGDKWGGALGTGVSMTFSFMNTQSRYASNYSGDNEYMSTFMLSSTQQSNIRSGLQAWSNVANLKFTEVTDSATTAGDIRFGGYAQMEGAYAWAYNPFEAPAGGDVWFSRDWSNESDARKGSYEYLTIIHEIGHALGLKHPFEAEFTGATLPASTDSTRYTVMSYTHQFDYAPTTPMLYDIQVMQYLYGKNSAHNTGNNTYSWAAGSKIFETIWDGGGTDTISASNQLAAVKINLNAGQKSTIGAMIGADLNNDGWLDDNGVNDLLYIAYGTTIENATGSAYADTLTGNSAANVLNGGGGADSMYGGTGNDVYYVDNASDYISETAGAGTDKVISTDSCILGANLENLQLTGTANTNGSGNNLSNLLTGNAGNNNFKGYLGNDTIDGGSGIDFVDYRNTDSKINVVLRTGSVTGGADNDKLINIEGVRGGNGNDYISGNTAVNSLYGELGNDTLSGDSGNDGLNSGAGNDLLIGGSGRDWISGGAGADRFDFNAATDLGLGSSYRDVITDFKHSEGDKIDLASIDANGKLTGDQAFKFIGNTAFSGDATGAVRFSAGVVQISTDADTAAEFEIQLTGVTTLAASDFIL